MNTSPNWSALLRDAVNQPGIISIAYSAFHNYSVGNQMLAYSQCAARDIPIAPLATFKRWQELGRSVKKGRESITALHARHHHPQG
jgi:antirestriction protein ArdC